MDDVGLLLRVLPAWVQEAVVANGTDGLEEIVLDIDRPLALRYPDGHRILDRPVRREDIHHIVHRVRGFRDDNRTGIDRTVHRISCIRDRYGEIVGLTIRVGRAVPGAAEFLRDLILGGKSMLFVGAPGSGKTTILRDAARILAARLGPKVVIVDTSNEIGGDGRVPHPGIGLARRIQVPEPSMQAKILMQAIANHGPAAVVIDEIGFHGDVEAVITIARRGVQMIATAHGRTIGDVVENPDLAPLLGGITRSGRERKRVGPPVFQACCEVLDRDRVVVHPDAASSVDSILRGEEPHDVEMRVRVMPGASEAEIERAALEGLREAVQVLVGDPDGAGRITPDGVREAVHRLLGDDRLRAVLRDLQGKGPDGVVH